MFGNTWWTNPKDLDDDQRKVISLTTGKSHLIVGPAGSGKTNVLLLRASYLHAAGVKDIVVLTLGRVLREFLVSGSDNYSFSPDKIMTYVHWAASVVGACGIDVDMKGTFDEIRAQLLAALKSMSPTQIKSHSCECLLIDEAQDYSQEEIAVLSKYAMCTFAAGDSRQQITKAKGGLKECEDLCDGSFITLTHHYRNGIRICRVADGIMNVIDHEDGMEASSKYDEDKMESSVRVGSYQNIDEQVQAACIEIEKQLIAYPEELIGILCPKLDDFDAVVAAVQHSPIREFAQYQKFLAGYTPFDASKRVIVASIHGAKGLEFRAVHVVASENLKRFPTQRQMAYTAVTRAKTSLRIYHKGALPGYFERGLAAVDEDVSGPPTIDSLFKKAK